MIPAFLKGKLIVEDNHIKTNEDFKTSCSIGLLQYLSDDVFEDIIQHNCKGIGNFGAIQSFNFCEHTDSSFTLNDRYVEPDVWIETDNYDVIIEAKKDDISGQNYDQWKKEIQSIKNEQNKRDSHKNIVLIALGGNDTLKKEVFENTPVYKVSWFNLLNTVVNKRQECNCQNYICRLLDDIISLFASQGILVIEWFDSLQFVPPLKIDNIGRWIIPANVGVKLSNELIINDKSIKIWDPIN